MPNPINPNLSKDLTLKQLALIVLVTCLVPACPAVGSSSSSEADAGESDFLLIDVHVPHSVDIAGTDLGIDFKKTEVLSGAIGDSKAAMAIVYCKTGPMSELAAQSLVAQGYCAIYDVPGGYNQWKMAGYAMAE